MKNVLGLVLLLVLWIGGSLYLGVGADKGLGFYDEGVRVYGAERVLNGDLPYRDFWSLYSPGLFYFYALLFKLFGSSLIVERIANVFCGSTLAIAVFLLARRIASPLLAFVPWLLTILWYGQTVDVRTNPVSVALSDACPVLFVYLGCLAAALFVRTERPSALRIAGMLAGVTILLKHDYGLYTLSATVLFLLCWVVLKEPAQAQLPVRERLSGAGTPLAAYGFGCALVLLPAASVFAVLCSPTDLLSNLFLFPIASFSKVRSLPYPSPLPDLAILGAEGFSLRELGRDLLHRSLFHIPFVAFLMSFVYILRGYLQKRHLGESCFLALLILLLGTVHINAVRIRSDLFHLTPVMVPTFLLLTFCLNQCLQSRDLPRWAKQGILLFLLGCFVPLLWQPFKSKLLLHSSPGVGYALSLERAKGILMSSQLATCLEETVTFVDKVVPPQEKIFVGNSRHDRIFINNVMFYFLARRRPAIRYHELHPGIATTLEAQREIIEELERSEVQWIVLWKGSEGVHEPNDSSRSSGVTLLDDFVRKSFRPVQTCGDYTVYHRLIENET